MDKRHKDLIKELLPTKRVKDRAHRIMTLGSIIKALQHKQNTFPVFIDFSDTTFIGPTKKYPGKPHSYYGYPTDLAFEPSNIEITVEEFKNICIDCLGRSFMASDESEGFYKDYTITVGSHVWISPLNSASTLGIADIIVQNNNIVLQTALTPSPTVGVLHGDN